MAEVESSTKKRRGNPHPKPPSVSHRTSAWLSSAVYAWVRERIAAAGGDPTQIPEEQFPRLMRLPEVVRVCGVSQASIYAWGKEGKFPRPIPLS